MRHSHSRRFDLPFHWPEPPLHVVLVEPQIPPNTGNVARLCAGTGCRLHLVEPMAFRITDAKLKRAGLDYWDSIKPAVHPSFADLERALEPRRFLFFSTCGRASHFEARYTPGDVLVFGSETRGLPDQLLTQHASSVYGIPILTEHIRSLNLSTSVGIVVYEALRQINLAAAS